MIFYILYEVFLLWAQFQCGFVTHRMHKTCGCPAALSHIWRDIFNPTHISYLSLEHKHLFQSIQTEIREIIRDFLLVFSSMKLRLF